MSRIANRFKEIKEQQNQGDSVEESKTSISIRVDDLNLYYIEKLRAEIGGSRSGVVQELVCEGVAEALEALGFDMETLSANFTEEIFKKQKASKKGAK